MPFSRRKFLKRALVAAPIAFGGAVAEAALVEPEWLKVEQVTLGNGGRKFIQFSDVHHRGDAKYLQRVVDVINSHKPELVFFTGDLVEESSYFAPALDIIKKIKAPLYGIPGNHDFWAGADFDLAREVFAAQGGRWLMDEDVHIGDKLKIFGVTGGRAPSYHLLKDGTNILLSHYPDWWKHIEGARFDAILSGHSHGGQVRLPGVGAVLTPSRCGEFDMGLYHTPAGPMYVNPGIGYFYANVRFCCRPEITILHV